MTCLAVIENDLSTQKLIQEVAEQCGFQVFCAATLEDGYSLFERVRIEIAIIDRLLDDGDGLELVEYLATELPQIKLLLLSQKSEVPERIRGLEFGADDYMGKPFSLAELKLRLQVLAHRTKQLDQDALRIGELILYPETGKLVLGEAIKQVRRREAQILACLIRYKNQVVSRDQLITSVWALSENPTYSTVDVYIRRIRVILGAYSDVIHTIRGFGYMASER